MKKFLAVLLTILALAGVCGAAASAAQTPTWDSMLAEGAAAFFNSTNLPYSSLDFSSYVDSAAGLQSFYNSFVSGSGTLADSVINAMPASRANPAATAYAQAVANIQAQYAVWSIQALTSQKPSKNADQKMQALLKKINKATADLYQDLNAAQAAQDFDKALKITKKIYTAQVKLMAQALHTAAPKDLAQAIDAPHWVTIDYGWRVVLMIAAFGWIWMR